MIASFANSNTEKLFNNTYVKMFDQITDAGRRKLRLLDNAQSLKDLQVPPGNKLEALVGDRKGQYSIRINKQYRVCFVWDGDGKGASSVEINNHYES